MPDSVSTTTASRLPKSPRCRSVEATFKLLPNRQVRMYFSKQSVPPAFVNKYLRAGKFEMPFHMDLPADILRDLNLSTYRINAGIYDVREDSDFFIIDY
jgi:hypothetical protein